MIPGVKRRTFTFHDMMVYLAIFRSHLRLMVLIMALAFSVALVYFAFARPVFGSKSTVRMEIVDLPVSADKIYRDGRRDQVIRELQSSPVLERTARRLGVRASAQTLRREHFKKLLIRTNSERDLDIGFYPYKKEWATQFPKLLVEEYLRFREEKRIEAYENTVRSYTREMEDVLAKLEERGERRFDFANEREMTEAEMAVQRLKSLPFELVQLQQRLAELRSAQRRIETEDLDTIARLSLLDSVLTQRVGVGDVIGASTLRASSESTAIPESSGSDSQTTSPVAATGVVVVPSMVEPEKPWRILEREYRRIEAEIARQGETYLPGHKIMRDLNRQFLEVQRNLDVEYQTAQVRLDLEIAQAESRLADLEQQIPEVNESKRAYGQLKRDFDIQNAPDLAWNQMYRSMAKRLSTLDFVQDKERIQLQYIGLAEYHERPISPNRSRVFLLALVGGLAAAIVIPFLIEYLDHTVSDLEEVETTFRIRGLGIVPQIAEAQMAPPALAEASDEQSQLVENFRVIRTNLMSVSMNSKAPQVVMVTSAMPKEGKTVISSNLAHSFARTGGSCILLDTDLRRGRMHRLFGYRKSPGLSEHLLGEVSLDQAIRPSGVPGLDIVSAGKHIDSGTELLGSDRFAGLMETLRQRYERIILDTPPVLGLSETGVVQPLVDGVLFVIWSGHTSIKSVKAAIEALQSNGANFYGFVLNRLDLSKTKNYYQYYYYSNDYYYNYHALENA